MRSATRNLETIVVLLDPTDEPTADSSLRDAVLARHGEDLTEAILNAYGDFDEAREDFTTQRNE